MSDISVDAGNDYKKQNSKKMNFCPVPFQEMEIHQDGNVYLCCPFFNDYYSCGNVFESSFEDVWNSDKAVDLRQRIKNGDYSLCNKEVCFVCKSKNFVPEFKSKFEARMIEHPKRIKFCYDHECNIACVICRDKINRLSDEQLKKWDDKIDSFFLPMLKNAEVLSVNAAGEAFASRHSRKLIKIVSQRYPDIKFEFLTNGILCNEQTFNDLNIKPEQIHTIRISMHAATKQTYAKMVVNGNLYFDKLMKNIKYLSNLKQKYNFLFYLNFVVTPLNYKDMPKFAAMAKKYCAVPFFWEYRKTCGNTPIEEFFILKKKHKDHKKLLKVLKHPDMYIFKDSLYPQLKSLQVENPKYSLTEKLEFMLGLY